MSTNDLTATALLPDIHGKTDEELSEYLINLGLSMTPLFLREVYRYLSTDKISPSHEVLKFFDDIFCSSVKNPKNITLGETSAADTEIMLTLNDVRQKASYLGKPPYFPITELLDISSEYLYTLDIKATDSVGVGESFRILNAKGNTLMKLGFNDEPPLRYGYVKENEDNENKDCKEISSSSDIQTDKIITPEGEINIKIGFVNRLLSFGETLNTNIESESITPTKYEKLLYITPESEKKSELYEATEIKDHFVSARCSSTLSFGDGMNSVLDSLFALLEKGVDRKKVGLTVKLSVRRENISRGICALLGAYRVIMELCLPQINSEIVFSDDEYILCAAFTQKSKSEKSNDDLFISVRKLYLLSFNRSYNSLPLNMPDFDGIRKMCDRLYSDINEGTVLMAHALNGTVGSVTDGMDITRDDSCIPEDTMAQGFVIEAKSFIKIDDPAIGLLVRSVDPEK